MSSCAHSPSGPHRQRSGWLARRWPTIAAVALLLVAWQCWVDFGHLPATFLASPTEIVRSIATSWPTLWPATATTLGEGLAGFLAAVAIGIALGALLYRSRRANAALFPLIAAAQTLPLISIAPLFLIWFGFEPAGKAVIVAVFAVFPVIVATIRGLESVPAFYSDVALTCGATQRWTLWHVKLRVAAPQVFSGVRISAAYVFSTAATAEYLGARGGLGIWIQAAYNSFRTARLFAATVMIALMTGLLLLAVRGVERLSLGAPGANDDPDAGQL